MLHKNRISFILLVVLASILVDSAQAWPRRRRARRYRSGGSKQIAPKHDEASADYRSLRAYFDYDRASAPEAALSGRIRVFMRMHDEKVLSAKEQIVAEVKIRDLSDHEKIAARLARQLSTRHRVNDELYREAEQAFGRTGLFDIAALMGLYHTVCTALTLFEVPAPN